jgi:hypothetical protein
MKRRIRTEIMALLFLSSLFAINSSIQAQDPTPSPSPSPASEVSPPAPATAPQPEKGFSKRDELTGDWGGDRARAREKGFDFEFKLTNFYQGVASGGSRSDCGYNGKFETEFKFDLGKIAGWKFWSAEFKTETRFGRPSLGGIGTIGPVNTSAITPGDEGGVFAVTALNFTRLIPIDLKKGNLVAISFGRFNTFDLVMEDFFGGAGIDRFFNIAENAPLTFARTVPIVTNGATIAWVRGGEPFLVVAVFDPNSHETNAGLKDLFADGVTISPGLNLSSKFSRSRDCIRSASRSLPRPTPLSIRSGRSSCPDRRLFRSNASGAQSSMTFS